MKLHSWDKITDEPLNAAMTRKVVHASNMTIAQLRLKKGGVVPRHSHINEQISFVQQGSLRFDFDSGSQVVGAGQMLEIPPDAPHSVEALEDTLVIDLFAPVREDWLRGNDAYLRR